LKSLGFDGADAFVLGMFAWALMGYANMYSGIAQRALDLALPGIKNKTSLGLSRSMAYHPEIQHAVAEMMLDFDPTGPHIDRIAEDWANGVDHGAAWPAKIISAKYHAVEACWRIVDRAMEVSGGAGMFRANELERLFRDARCGCFHPANTFLVHEFVAKTALGIGLGEQPRWGWQDPRDWGWVTRRLGDRKARRIFRGTLCLRSSCWCCRVDQTERRMTASPQLGRLRPARSLKGGNSEHSPIARLTSDMCRKRSFL
jgi:hypothetical protein